MEENEMMSLRARQKKLPGGISCCFSQHRRHASFDASCSSTAPPPMVSPRRSSPSLPEIKDKCRNFISRMGRHRRHSSADFSYDPLSYALNFNDDDELRALNFTARLPASPPMRFDHHHLQRSPIPRSPPNLYSCTDSREAVQGWKGSEEAGNGELRRGFEALADSMKESNVKEASLVEQRRNQTEPRAAAAAEVRRTLEEVKTSPPMRKREILVQLG